jgi:hypothetical protein
MYMKESDALLLIFFEHRALENVLRCLLEIGKNGIGIY